VLHCDAIDIYMFRPLPFPPKTRINTEWIPFKYIIRIHDISSVLQCVAVCCSVLQCVAVCYSVLQCAAVCCSVLQCAAVCCSVLQCAAVCCSVLQCAAVCCSVLQCITMCSSVLQCVAVRLHGECIPFESIGGIHDISHVVKHIVHLCRTPF